MLRTRTAYVLVLVLLLSAAFSHAAEKKVLVYTRNFVTNGKGFVHDNIKASVEAIKKLGQENGFAVDATDDPKAFTEENLKQYKALVFSNSNNEAFENDAQREAFKKFIQAGGGFVGVHSASGSERKWDYYWKVLGATFKFHPAQQALDLKVLDPQSPIVQGLPASFTWGPDECYHHKELSKDIKVLIAADPAQIPGNKSAQSPESLVNGQIPLVWSQSFDGGREVYIALGHNIPMYQDPVLLRLIVNGIKWTIGDPVLTTQVTPAEKRSAAEVNAAMKKAAPKAKAKAKAKGKGKGKKAAPPQQ